jgi:chromosome segregation ATPase
VSDHVRWLTYDEIAAEMDIERESARQLAIRKRWARQRGNDGKARVGVPEEELQARTSDATSQDTSESPSDNTGNDPSVIQVLTRHISRLEGEIEALKEERSAERDRLQSEIAACKQELHAERILSSQVDILKAVIEAERKRTEDMKAEQDRLRADRDRWAEQAERLAAARSWWSKILQRA